MSLADRQKALRMRMMEANRIEPIIETKVPEKTPISIKNSGHNAGTVRPQIIETVNFIDGAADMRSGVPAARLLDLKAAGEYLSLSYWTLRDLVFAGQIPAVKIRSPRRKDGGVIRRLLVDRRDLDTFIDNHKETEQQ